jgi:hypothetical protein
MRSIRVVADPSTATLAVLKTLQDGVSEGPFKDRVPEAKKAWASKTSSIAKREAFEEIKKLLTEACWGARRCNYSEDSVADEIEHFRTKDWYPDVAFAWSNYLYACGPCNGPKSNLFPLFPTQGSATVQELVPRKESDPIVPPPNGDPDCQYGKGLKTVERFDVASQTWVAHPDLAGPRILFGAVQVDGLPLLVGGASDTASLSRVELYDSAAEAFNVVAPLDNARLRPTVVSLGDGRVLAAAGKIANVGPIGVTELYDASINAWTEGPEIGAPRTGTAATTLQSGNALVVGGFNQVTGDVLDELMLFDAAANVWVTLPPMVEPRSLPSATLLQDGRVLIVGGSGGLSSAEIAE